MNIGCVVMAAGKAERFGSNKLLALLAGRPLLQHVLDALPRGRFARITAVTSDPAVTILCERCGVCAVQYGGGLQSETVRLGTEQMEGLDGCLFVQGDQPLCTARSMERLLDSFFSAPDDVHRLAFDGIPGSPVVFPARLFPDLLALTGERGGMAAARSAGARVRLTPAFAAYELLDADTEKALSELEKICLKKDLNSQEISRFAEEKA